MTPLGRQLLGLKPRTGSGYEADPPSTLRAEVSRRPVSMAKGRARESRFASRQLVIARRCVSTLIFVCSVGAVQQALAALTTILENPGQDGKVSGIGLVSDWTCSAEPVEVSFNGGGRIRVPSGGSRADTAGVCGRSDTGFGLLYNYNLLGTGMHTAQLYLGGVPFGAPHSFSVTVPAGEFLSDISKLVDVAGFPNAGQVTTLEWQQSAQNFVIAGSPTVVPPPNGSAPPRTVLENPGNGGKVSGIGLISGWTCSTAAVEVSFNGGARVRVPSGGSRADTAGVCGRSDTGFGLLYNYNLLGTGTHTAQLYLGGEAVGGPSLFSVTAPAGEFIQGRAKTVWVPGFPTAVMTSQLVWQESSQNFVISGVSTPAMQGVTGTACINPHLDSTYPDSFRGKYALPTTTGELAPAVERSVGLKDYNPQLPTWWAAYSVPNGCKGDAYRKILYRDSLDRLKALGSDYVELYIGGSWTVDPSLSYWVQKPENLSHSYELIEYIASEARKRGLKTSLVWMLNIVDDKGNFLLNLGDRVDKALWERLLLSHKTNIIEIAKLAERVGINRLAADWSAMGIGNLHDPEIQEIYVQNMLATIDGMRGVFKGEISLGQFYLWHDFRLIDKIDVANISLIPRLSEYEMASLSSDLVMEKAAKELLRLYQDFNCIVPSRDICTATRSPKAVPVVFHLAIQSVDGYLTGKGTEDGFCIRGLGSDGKETDCVQATLGTDFSAQAIAVDGAIRAIRAQKYFPLQGINFHSSYWHTNSLRPSTGFISTQFGRVEDAEGFPNLSQSIRGKPAEQIVKRWFSR